MSGAEDDFIMAPGEIAARDEGFTELTYRLEGEGRERQQDIVSRTNAGLSKLTLNGGQGDGVSALVGGEVLTVKESVALAIARDMVRDAEARTGKPAHEIALLELNEGLDERVKGRATTVGQVMAELGRLQNLSRYGDAVRRR